MQTDYFQEAPPLPEEDRHLLAAYAAVGRTVDDLPYTSEFEEIFKRRHPRDDRDRRAIFHRLHNLRKAGRLPRVGRGNPITPTLTEDQQSMLQGMIEETVGSLGRRDQLPYSPQFDQIVEQFNHANGLRLSPHDVWRLVARLAK